MRSAIGYPRSATSIKKYGYQSVSAPRMSNLFKGYLEKFSIDTLLEMLVRIGYKVDADFNPENRAQPLVINVKKVTL